MQLQNTWSDGAVMVQPGLLQLYRNWPWEHWKGMRESEGSYPRRKFGIQTRMKENTVKLFCQPRHTVSLLWILYCTSLSELFIFFWSLIIKKKSASSLSSVQLIYDAIKMVRGILTEELHINRYLSFTWIIPINNTFPPNAVVTVSTTILWKLVGLLLSSQNHLPKVFKSDLNTSEWWILLYNSVILLYL